jgi:hypothetical protein
MEWRRELRSAIGLGVVITQKVFDLSTELAIAPARIFEKQVTLVTALRRGVDEDLSRPLESISAHQRLPD